MRDIDGCEIQKWLGNPVCHTEGAFGGLNMDSGLNSNGQRNLLLKMIFTSDIEHSFNDTMSLSNFH